MRNTKQWYESRTVWGGLIALGAAIAQGLGYTIGDVNQELLVDHISAVVAGVGGLLAIWGRLKAEKEIE